jgi:uncharacterized protein DUF3365
VVAGSLAWNLVQHADEAKDLASQTARALLEKDLFYRQWSILQGGVYVPKSRQAGTDSPSHDEGRDLVTPSGETLTLLNPAIVSRQIFSLQDQQMNIRGHLTSLKPFRPENGPDAWERRALEEFETGRQEASAVETREGEQYFRLMQPLVTVQACLRCHEEQGRKPGQIRGGISVTVPMRQFISQGGDLRLGVAHAGLWLIGMTGLVFGAKDLRRHVRALQKAETERERLIVELQEALANVKTLTGLIPICAGCKKIRNDQGYWTQLETYLEQHSQAEFSHGLCLDCMRKLYPDVAQEVEARLAQTASPSGFPGKEPRT